MITSALARHVALASALCVLTGCSAGDTAPVSGAVMLNGQPIGGATVTFKHEGSGDLRVGTTQEDGAFVLSSPGSRDQSGAKVGRHQVMISAVRIVQPQPAGDPSIGSLSIATAGDARIEHLLPIKYGDFETSGLTFDVAAGRKNVAEFQLGD